MAETPENETTPPTEQKTPQTIETHLGIAGWMAQAFIHSPLSPLFFFALLFMGIMGLVLTPRQEDPQISVPMIDVFVAYPGASAEQVSHLVVEPLQRVLSDIPDVKHVYGASERGRGMATVQFEVGEELEKSIFKVHDKLQSNITAMPPGVHQPLVKPVGIDDVPVVTLTMWSKEVDEGALRTLASDVLQHLKEIPNTGQGFIVGGRKEQVRVEISPERLSGFGISLAQVAQTIQTANSEDQAGNVESNNMNYTVYTGGFLRSAQDVSNLVIGMHESRPVYVRDVATVFQGGEEVNNMVAYYTGAAYGHGDENKANTPSTNAPAVTIAVAKKIGTNGVAVADDILAMIDGLKGRIIPDNIHVEVTRNYGETAENKVNALIKKLFIATAAVTVLVLFSLGIRPAIVVTLVIPVVILITIFSAFILGFTIDRVSLFALIFSIGILVDDAIVVIENIYRRWLEKGSIDTATAIDAVREVGNPTILATFTVIAALMPMGFVTGMMGPYMMPIPVLGSVAMLFSLLAAFMFTPWLAMKIRPSLEKLHKDERKEHAFNERLEKIYNVLLTPLLENSKLGFLFLLSLVALFFLSISMFYYQSVNVKMLPLDNKPEFSVFVDLPDGTALPETANIAHRLAEKLREFPEVTAIQTYVGTSQPFDFNGMVRHYYLRQQPWQADIHVQLTDKEDRKRSSHEIATEARRMVKELTKNDKVNLTVVEMPPGPPVLQSVVAEIYGDNNEIRHKVANDLTQIFKNAKTMDDVDNYMVDNKPTWHFEVDTEKAVRRGISVDTINKNLAMALGGYQIGDIKRGTVLEPTYIVLQIPLNIRSQLSRLYDLPIPTLDSQSTVPLAELGRFVQTNEDEVIYHKNLRRVEYVVGEAVGLYEGDNQYDLSSPIYGILEIEKALQDYKTPDNVTLSGYFTGPPPANGLTGFEWAGEWTVTYETFRDMGIAFGIAMVLIYILVVGLFGNFLVPMIIMSPIPLTLLGIIPGHWLFDAEFTATSMIGWIALAGIIVRNSILLVDYSIFEVQQGMPIRRAVMLACKTRTRPILITAFALVGGASVILSDPIFQGMAISLLFGVLISSLLTLVVIPLGCITIGPDRLCAGSGGRFDHTAEEEAKELKEYEAHSKEVSKPSLALRIWGKMVDVLSLLFYLVRAIGMMLVMGVQFIFKKLTPAKQQDFTPAPVTEKPTPLTVPVVEPVAETEPTPDEVAEKLKTKPAAKPRVRKTTTAPKTGTRRGIRTKSDLTGMDNNPEDNS